MSVINLMLQELDERRTQPTAAAPCPPVSRPWGVHPLRPLHVGAADCRWRAGQCDRADECRSRRALLATP